jgi:hypothetical protein
MKAAILSTLVLLIAPWAATAADGDNLALGRPYTLSPAPNYALCTDPGDAVQLTDGKYAGPDTFWGQPATVGWSATNPIRITIYLGAVKSIAGVSFSTASRVNAGVYWPSIIVGVSDDGATYHIAGQIPAASAEGQDVAQEYRKRLQLTDLRTRGRFVLLFIVPGGPYVFADEVEVLAGAHDPNQVALTGRALTPAGFDEYLGLARQQAWLAQQAQRLADRVGAESRAASPGNDGTLTQLREVADGLMVLAKRIPSLPLDPDRLSDARRQLASLCAQANAVLRPGLSRFVWDHDPWAPLSPFEFVPRTRRRLTRLDVYAASNEYSSAAITVTNLTPSPMTLKPRLESLRRDGDRAVEGTATSRAPAVEVQLRRVEFVEAATGQLVADALPLLDERGLRLGPGETSQLWLTFAKRRLRPGEYRGRIILNAGSDQPSTTIEIALHVYPVELPDQMRLQTYNWAYVTTFPLVRGLEREAVADLFAHYTNTFVFSGADVPWPQFDEAGKGRIDFTAHDRNLALHRGAREISWFWSFSDGSRPDGGRFGAEYLSPQWKERFSWWLRAWVAHLKDLGFGYDDFFMYPFDETLCDRFRALARFIKEVDPSIRIFADPVSADNRERIEAIAPYVDIWCPHLFTFERRLADLEFMRAQATSTAAPGRVPPAAGSGMKKLWTYVCSGPAKTLSPHSYYRLMMWKAWQRGYTGCGFWAYADAGWGGDNAWNDFDGANPDFAVIYTARTAPPGVPRGEAIIPSKRWEAWREGIEDYEVMGMVEDAARRAEMDGATARATELRALLKSGVEAALAAPDDAAAAERARHRMLESLSRDRAR